MRLRVLPPVVVTAVALSAAAAPAGAAEPVEERVCAARATLKESPDGLTIGWVTRGHEVLVLRRTRDGRWVRVRTDFGARGWLRTPNLCRRG